MTHSYHPIQRLLSVLLVATLLVTQLVFVDPVEGQQAQDELGIVALVVDDSVLKDTTKVASKITDLARANIGELTRDAKLVEELRTMGATLDTSAETIQSRIMRYAQDIQRTMPMTKVLIVPVSTGEKVDEPWQIREALMNLALQGDPELRAQGKASRLKGAVFIGDVPLPLVTKDQSTFVSMYPYTDFVDPLYTFDHIQHTFVRSENVNDPQPEIWHGVIRYPQTFQLFSQEGEKAKGYRDARGSGKLVDYLAGQRGAFLAEQRTYLAEYFDKNHSYYTGGVYSQISKRALYADFARELDTISQVMVKGYNEYLENWDNISYMRYTKDWLSCLQSKFSLDNGVLQPSRDPCDFNKENILVAEKETAKQEKIVAANKSQIRGLSDYEQKTLCPAVAKALEKYPSEPKNKKYCASIGNKQQKSEQGLTCGEVEELCQIIFVRDDFKKEKSASKEPLNTEPQAKKAVNIPNIIPDVQTKSMIEGFLKKSVDVFPGSMAQARQAFENTGRWSMGGETNLTGHTIPSIIYELDTQSRKTILHMNDALEKELDTMVDTHILHNPYTQVDLPRKDTNYFGKFFELITNRKYVPTGADAVVLPPPTYLDISPYPTDGVSTIGDARTVLETFRKANEKARNANSIEPYVPFTGQRYDRVVRHSDPETAWAAQNASTGAITKKVTQSMLSKIPGIRIFLSMNSVLDLPSPCELTKENVAKNNPFLNALKGVVGISFPGTPTINGIMGCSYKNPNPTQLRLLEITGVPRLLSETEKNITKMTPKELTKDFQTILHLIDTEFSAQDCTIFLGGGLPTEEKSAPKGILVEDTWDKKVESLVSKEIAPIDTDIYSTKQAIVLLEKQIGDISNESCTSDACVEGRTQRISAVRERIAASQCTIYSMESKKNSRKIQEVVKWRKYYGLPTIEAQVEVSNDSCGAIDPAAPCKGEGSSVNGPANKYCSTLYTVTYGKVVPGLDRDKLYEPLMSQLQNTDKQFAQMVEANRLYNKDPQALLMEEKLEANAGDKILEFFTNEETQRRTVLNPMCDRSTYADPNSLEVKGYFGACCSNNLEITSSGDTSPDPADMVPSKIEVRNLLDATRIAMKVEGAKNTVEGVVTGLIESPMVVGSWLGQSAIKLYMWSSGYGDTKEMESIFVKTTPRKYDLYWSNIALFANYNDLKKLQDALRGVTLFPPRFHPQDGMKRFKLLSLLLTILTTEDGKGNFIGEKILKNLATVERSKHPLVQLAKSYTKRLDQNEGGWKGRLQAVGDIVVNAGTYDTYMTMQGVGGATLTSLVDSLPLRTTGDMSNDIIQSTFQNITQRLRTSEADLTRALRQTVNKDDKQGQDGITKYAELVRQLETTPEQENPIDAPGDPTRTILALLEEEPMPETLKDVVTVPGLELLAKKSIALLQDLTYLEKLEPGAKNTIDQYAYIYKTLLLEEMKELKKLDSLDNAKKYSAFLRVHAQQQGSWWWEQIKKPTQPFDLKKYQNLYSRRVQMMSNFVKLLAQMAKADKKDERKLFCEPTRALFPVKDIAGTKKVGTDTYRPLMTNQPKLLLEPAVQFPDKDKPYYIDIQGRIPEKKEYLPRTIDNLSSADSLMTTAEMEKKSAELGEEDIMSTRDGVVGYKRTIDPNAKFVKRTSFNEEKNINEELPAYPYTPISSYKACMEYAKYGTPTPDPITQDTSFLITRPVIPSSTDTVYLNPIYIALLGMKQFVLAEKFKTIFEQTTGLMPSILFARFQLPTLENILETDVIVKNKVHTTAIPSVIRHKEPTKDTISRQLKTSTAEALPVDAPRYIDFQLYENIPYSRGGDQSFFQNEGLKLVNKAKNVTRIEKRDELYHHVRLPYVDLFQLYKKSERLGYTTKENFYAALKDIEKRWSGVMNSYDAYLNDTVRLSGVAGQETGLDKVSFSMKEFSVALQKSGIGSLLAEAYEKSKKEKPAIFQGDEQWAEKYALAFAIYWSKLSLAEKYKFVLEHYLSDRRDGLIDPLYFLDTKTDRDTTIIDKNGFEAGHIVLDGGMHQIVPLKIENITFTGKETLSFGALPVAQPKLPQSSPVIADNPCAQYAGISGSVNIFEYFPALSCWAQTTFSEATLKNITKAGFTGEFSLDQWTKELGETFTQVGSAFEKTGSEFGRFFSKDLVQLKNNVDMALQGFLEGIIDQDKDGLPLLAPIWANFGGKPLAVDVNEFDTPSFVSTFTKQTHLSSDAFAYAYSPRLKKYITTIAPVALAQGTVQDGKMKYTKINTAETTIGDGFYDVQDYVRALTSCVDLAYDVASSRKTCQEWRDATEGKVDTPVLSVFAQTPVIVKAELMGITGLDRQDKNDASYLPGDNFTYVVAELDDDAKKLVNIEEQRPVQARNGSARFTLRPLNSGVQGVGTIQFRVVRGQKGNQGTLLPLSQLRPRVITNEITDASLGEIPPMPEVVSPKMKIIVKSLLPQIALINPKKTATASGSELKTEKIFSTRDQTYIPMPFVLNGNGEVMKEFSGKAITMELYKKTKKGTLELYNNTILQKTIPALPLNAASYTQYKQDIPKEGGTYVWKMRADTTLGLPEQNSEFTIIEDNVEGVKILPTTNTVIVGQDIAFTPTFTVKEGEDQPIFGGYAHFVYTDTSTAQDNPLTIKYLGNAMTDVYPQTSSSIDFKAGTVEKFLLGTSLKEGKTFTTPQDVSVSLSLSQGLNEALAGKEYSSQFTDTQKVTVYPKGYLQFFAEHVGSDGIIQADTLLSDTSPRLINVSVRDKTGKNIPAQGTYNVQVEDEGMFVSHDAHVTLYDGLGRFAYTLSGKSGKTKITISDPAGGIAVFALNLVVQSGYVQKVAFVHTITTPLRAAQIEQSDAGSEADRARRMTYELYDRFGNVAEEDVKGGNQEILLRIEPKDGVHIVQDTLSLSTVATMENSTTPIATYMVLGPKGGRGGFTVQTKEFTGEARLTIGLRDSTARLPQYKKETQLDTVLIPIRYVITPELLKKWSPNMLYVNLFGGAYGNVMQNNFLAGWWLLAGKTQAITTTTVTKKYIPNALRVLPHGVIDVPTRAQGGISAKKTLRATMGINRPMEVSVFDPDIKEYVARVRYRISPMASMEILSSLQDLAQKITQRSLGISILLQEGVIAEKKTATGSDLQGYVFQQAGKDLFTITNDLQMETYGDGEYTITPNKERKDVLELQITKTLEKTPLATLFVILPQMELYETTEKAFDLKAVEEKRNATESEKIIPKEDTPPTPGPTRKDFYARKHDASSQEVATIPSGVFSFTKPVSSLLRVATDDQHRDPTLFLGTYPLFTLRGIQDMLNPEDRAKNTYASSVHVSTVGEVGLLDTELYWKDLAQTGIAQLKSLLRILPVLRQEPFVLRETVDTYDPTEPGLYLINSIARADQGIKGYLNEEQGTIQIMNDVGTTKVLLATQYPTGKIVMTDPGKAILDISEQHSVVAGRDMVFFVHYFTKKGTTEPLVRTVVALKGGQGMRLLSASSTPVSAEHRGVYVTLNDSTYSLDVVQQGIFKKDQPTPVLSFAQGNYFKVDRLTTQLIRDFSYTQEGMMYRLMDDETQIGTLLIQLYEKPLVVEIGKKTAPTFEEHMKKKEGLELYVDPNQAVQEEYQGKYIWRKPNSTDVLFTLDPVLGTWEAKDTSLQWVLSGISEGYLSWYILDQTKLPTSSQEKPTSLLEKYAIARGTLSLPAAYFPWITWDRLKHTPEDKSVPGWYIQDNAQQQISMNHSLDGGKSIVFFGQEPLLMIDEQHRFQKPASTPVSVSHKEHEPQLSYSGQEYELKIGDAVIMAVQIKLPKEGVNSYMTYPFRMIKQLYAYIQDPTADPLLLFGPHVSISPKNITKTIEESNDRMKQAELASRVTLDDTKIVANKSEYTRINLMRFPLTLRSSQENTSTLRLGTTELQLNVQRNATTIRPISETLQARTLLKEDISKEVLEIPYDPDSRRITVYSALYDAGFREGDLVLNSTESVVRGAYFNDLKSTLFPNTILPQVALRLSSNYQDPLMLVVNKNYVVHAEELSLEKILLTFTEESTTEKKHVFQLEMMNPNYRYIPYKSSEYYRNTTVTIEAEQTEVQPKNTSIFDQYKYSYAYGVVGDAVKRIGQGAIEITDAFVQLLDHLPASVAPIVTGMKDPVLSFVRLFHVPLFATIEKTDPTWKKGDMRLYLYRDDVPQGRIELQTSEQGMLQGIYGVTTNEQKEIVKNPAFTFEDPFSPKAHMPGARVRTIEYPEGLALRLQATYRYDRIVEEVMNGKTQTKLVTDEKLETVGDIFYRILPPDTKFTIEQSQESSSTTGSSLGVPVTNATTTTLTTSSHGLGNFVPLSKEFQAINGAGLYVENMTRLKPYTTLARAQSQEQGVVAKELQSAFEPWASGTHEPLAYVLKDPSLSVNAIDTPGSERIGGEDSLDEAGKSVGFQGDMKNMVLFAGGNSVGQSTQTNMSETLINMGDPVLSLTIGDNDNRTNDYYTEDIGELIYHHRGGNIASLVLFDVDGDGRKDIVYAEQAGTIYTLRNEGGHPVRWRFMGPLYDVPEGVTQMLVTEWNGDGKPDILFGTKNALVTPQVTTSPTTPQASTSSLLSWLPFASARQTTVMNLSSLVNGSLLPLVHKGGGVFDKGKNIFAQLGRLRSFQIGDIDGNGSEELIGLTDNHEVKVVFYGGNAPAGLSSSPDCYPTPAAPVTGATVICIAALGMSVKPTKDLAGEDVFVRFLGQGGTPVLPQEQAPKQLPFGQDMILIRDTTSDLLLKEKPGDDCTNRVSGCDGAAEVNFLTQTTSKVEQVITPPASGNMKILAGANHPYVVSAGEKKAELETMLREYGATLDPDAREGAVLERYAGVGDELTTHKSENSPLYITKFARDVSGGKIREGDTVEYTLQIKSNAVEDGAGGVSSSKLLTLDVADRLPVEGALLPGSVQCMKKTAGVWKKAPIRLPSVDGGCGYAPSLSDSNYPLYFHNISLTRGEEWKMVYRVQIVKDPFPLTLSLGTYALLKDNQFLTSEDDDIIKSAGSKKLIALSSPLLKGAGAFYFPWYKGVFQKRFYQPRKKTDIENFPLLKMATSLFGKELESMGVSEDKKKQGVIDTSPKAEITITGDDKDKVKTYTSELYELMHTLFTTDRDFDGLVDLWDEDVVVPREVSAFERVVGNTPEQYSVVKKSIIGVSANGSSASITSGSATTGLLGWVKEKSSTLKGMMREMDQMMNCKNAGCGLFPFNYALGAPGKGSVSWLPGIDIPIFAAISIDEDNLYNPLNLIPFFPVSFLTYWTKPNRGNLNNFRMYLIPTLSGRIAFTTCVMGYRGGEQITENLDGDPIKNCIKPIILPDPGLLKLCDDLAQHLGWFIANTTSMVTGNGAVVARAKKNIGSLFQSPDDPHGIVPEHFFLDELNWIPQEAQQSIIGSLDTNRAAYAPRTTRTYPEFPSVIMGWIRRQFTELKKMVRLPQFTLRLPDVVGYNMRLQQTLPKKWNELTSQDKIEKDTEKKENAEVADHVRTLKDEMMKTYDLAQLSSAEQSKRIQDTLTKQSDAYRMKKAKELGVDLSVYKKDGAQTFTEADRVIIDALLTKKIVGQGTFAATMTEMSVDETLFDQARKDQAKANQVGSLLLGEKPETTQRAITIERQKQVFIDGFKKEAQSLTKEKMIQRIRDRGGRAQDLDKKSVEDLRTLYVTTSMNNIQFESYEEIIQRVEKMSDQDLTSTLVTLGLNINDISTKSRQERIQLLKDKELSKTSSSTVMKGLLAGQIDQQSELTLKTAQGACVKQPGLLEQAGCQYDVVSNPNIFLNSLLGDKADAHDMTSSFTANDAKKAFDKGMTLSNLIQQNVPGVSDFVEFVGLIPFLSINTKQIVFEYPWLPPEKLSFLLQNFKDALDQTLKNFYTSYLEFRPCYYDDYERQFNSAEHPTLKVIDFNAGNYEKVWTALQKTLIQNKDASVLAQLDHLTVQGKVELLCGNAVHMHREAWGYIQGIQEMVETIKSYPQFIKQLQKYTRYKVQTFDRAVNYATTIMDYLSSWVNKQSGILRAWKQTVADVRSFNVVLDGFIEAVVRKPESCRTCVYEKDTKTEKLLEQFALSLLPIDALPVFKAPRLIPDVILDLSNITFQLQITLPDIKLQPYELDLPRIQPYTFPSLRGLTSLTGNVFSTDQRAGVSVALPQLPRLPILPDLPQLPPLPDLVLPTLPDLFPAPSIPDIGYSIDVVLDVLGNFFDLACAIRTNMEQGGMMDMFVSESDLRWRIEDLTRGTFIGNPTKIQVPQWYIKSYDYVKFVVSLNVGTVHLDAGTAWLENIAQKWKSTVIDKGVASFANWLQNPINLGQLLDKPVNAAVGAVNEKLGEADNKVNEFIQAIRTDVERQEQEQKTLNISSQPVADHTTVRNAPDALERQVRADMLATAGDTSKQKKLLEDKVIALARTMNTVLTEMTDKKVPAGKLKERIEQHIADIRARQHLLNPGVGEEAIALLEEGLSTLDTHSYTEDKDMNNYDFYQQWSRFRHELKEEKQKSLQGVQHTLVLENAKRFSELRTILDGAGLLYDGAGDVFASRAPETLHTLAQGEETYAHIRDTVVQKMPLDLTQHETLTIHRDHEDNNRSDPYISAQSTSLKEGEYAEVQSVAPSLLPTAQAGTEPTTSLASGTSPKKGISATSAEGLVVQLPGEEGVVQLTKYTPLASEETVFALGDVDVPGKGDGAEEIVMTMGNDIFLKYNMRDADQFVKDVYMGTDRVSMTSLSALLPVLPPVQFVHVTPIDVQQHELSFALPERTFLFGQNGVRVQDTMDFELQVYGTSYDSIYGRNMLKAYPMSTETQYLQSSTGISTGPLTQEGISLRKKGNVYKGILMLPLNTSPYFIRVIPKARSLNTIGLPSSTALVFSQSAYDKKAPELMVSRGDVQYVVPGFPTKIDSYVYDATGVSQVHWDTDTGVDMDGDGSLENDTNIACPTFTVIFPGTRFAPECKDGFTEVVQNGRRMFRGPSMSFPATTFTEDDIGRNYDAMLTAYDVQGNMSMKKIRIQVVEPTIVIDSKDPSTGDITGHVVPPLADAPLRVLRARDKQIGEITFPSEVKTDKDGKFVLKGVR